MNFLSILALFLYAPAPAAAQEPQAAQAAREPFVTPFTAEEMSGKQALIETDLGVIAIDLRPELAPNHAGLVMRLAADGAFDGTTFHSMVRHGIVQGGDPLTRDPERTAEYGRGGLGLLDAELSDARHVRGTVSAVVAPGRPDSGGSQFFICVVDQPGLDGQHSIWGQVAEGMDVVTRISEAAVDDAGRAVERIVVRSLRIRDKPPPEAPPFSTESDAELAAFRALLDTTHGRMAIDLYPDRAPNHVRSFLRLVDAGVYDGVAFHRVVPGFVIQSGHLPTRSAPLTERQQRFVRNLEPEFNATRHVRGIVSMARLDDPASASTSFFIVTGTAPELDGQYTAFGVVSEGMEVVEAIEAEPTDGETPVNRVEIVSAKVVRR
ncbi:MAG: peptidylprolyl isomerase [Acidobacteria bacterium]|nr:peptidylprolyl isomerase [Acidobacteriota bacterium]